MQYKAYIIYIVQIFKEVLKMVFNQIIRNMGLSERSIIMQCCRLQDLAYSYHNYNIFVDESAIKKIGLEIELTYVNMATVLHMIEKQKLNCKYYKSNDNNILFANDSSISDVAGVEFITPALNIDETIEKATELLNIIEADGENGAGFHIHFDKWDWFNNSDENICKFIAICSMWQRCLFEVSQRTRHEWERWSRQNIDYVSTAIELLEDLYYDTEDHAVLINLEHEETIEYRGFKATINSCLLESRVKFIAELINFTNKLTVSEAINICKNRTYSNNMLDLFLNKFDKTEDNKILEDIKLFIPKKKFYKNCCMLHIVTEKKFISDIYRPERSY